MSSTPPPRKNRHLNQNQTDTQTRRCYILGRYVAPTAALEPHPSSLEFRSLCCSALRDPWLKEMTGSVQPESSEFQLSLIFSFYQKEPFSSLYQEEASFFPLFFISWAFLFVGFDWTLFLLQPENPFFLIKYFPLFQWKGLFLDLSETTLFVSLIFAITVYLMAFPFDKHFSNCTFCCSWDREFKFPTTLQKPEVLLPESLLFTSSPGCPDGFFLPAPRRWVPVLVFCFTWVHEELGHFKMNLGLARQQGELAGELTAHCFTKALL